MQLNNKEIKRIFNKYKQAFIEMEHYDQTREILWARRRIDITLQERVIKRLKEISKQTGKPVSHIIEEAVLSKVH
jgi:hypothetical protein